MNEAHDAHPKRIGMLGGAFDPPHRGHVVLAQTALEQLPLDVLHVIPTGQAWHKTRTLSAAQHRLAMAQLAFSGMSGVQVDNRELQRQGPSYTVDTLRELASEYPGALLFLVLGEDQAHALSDWHEWQEVVRLASICVAKRADFVKARGFADTLESRIPALRYLNMPAVALSATQVRHHLATHGESVAPLIPDAVARYIERHRLYLST